ncbi:MAG: allantoinase PuuE [Pseudomonadota bacterium]
MHRYPRDLGGYGPNPPNAAWPGGAKIAIQIVVNYEEGGENNLLHGDPASEAFLSEIVGAAAWPGQRHWNMESIYEYGARAGFWRLHRLFTQRDIPVTVYGVATALARAPRQVSAMQDAGWEIASHGLKWIEHKDMSEAEETAQMEEAIALHAQVTGAKPQGWYTGRCSMNTVRLAARAGMRYISDDYADDLPYWVKIEGSDQLMIPYTLDANDMRFATPQGFNTGEQFEAYLRDTFDVLYEEGQEGAPKMMSIGLHCRLAGRPGRLAGLKRFLDHAQAHQDVWFARRIDIADHWAQTHPLQEIERPSQMSKSRFVEVFGEVFEHSAWIEEVAHGLELGPAHDCFEGVRSVLFRVFRAATYEQRLEVLRAHPDLAGKLAAAKRLTAASSAEQASAGLDALTDAERARFSELNEAYTARFGHPFIIAVRDNTKASILEAFERRLEHSAQDEFDEACRQVERIAELRLEALLPR